jgi:ferrochelatase
VRRYLAEFLSDPRVIEIPRFAWLPILHGVILRTRPKKSAHAYKQVWTEEGSPLAAITRRQSAALQEQLGEEVVVDFAMRYGNPGIGQSIENLAALGCERILVAPLYPQYCAATTATAMDAVYATLAKMRRQPALRSLPPYFDDDLHIEALKGSLERQLAALDFEPQRLLLSFHGCRNGRWSSAIPIIATARRRAACCPELLSIQTDIAFQSRSARQGGSNRQRTRCWPAYPREGVTRIAIAAPGFSADCVETAEELGIRGRETFLSSGGEAFARLECLNDSSEGMTMLDALVRRELAGWLPQP